MTQNSSEKTNTGKFNVVYVGAGGNIPDYVQIAISKINGAVVANKTIPGTYDKTIRLIKQNIQSENHTVFGEKITNNRLRQIRKTGLPFGVVTNNNNVYTIVPYNGFITTIKTGNVTKTETEQLVGTP